MKGASVQAIQNKIEPRAKKQMSLHPQTIRIRHRLVTWSKQGRKHWDLYRYLMDPFVLSDALKLVMSNKGSPGLDQERVEDMRGREWEYVTKLSESLQNRRYHPSAVKRVYIPKSDGKLRPLGIPRVRDRVIQRALVLLLEPIYENIFLDFSYGFRPNKSAPMCAADSANAMFKRRYVLEADIEGFFDHVVHRKLKGMLKEQIVDPRILDLISAFLTSGFIEMKKPWVETKEGTPQGGPLSPMLANIYLHYALDVKFEEKALKSGHTKIYRYCDDFIVMSDNKARLKSARRALYVWMKEAGLKLKDSKTREIDMSNQARSRENHFNFLGYKFHLRSFKDNPKNFWIARQPSEKSRRALSLRLKEKLTPNLSHEDARSSARSIWRGWSEYFRYGNANRVLYREVKSVRRAIYQYLRAKYRHQRRPVQWKKLFSIAEEALNEIRPPRVIPHPIKQSQTSFSYT
jgi:RNA-directed DNA polymerase